MDSPELKHHALRRLAHIMVGTESNIVDSVLEFLIEQTLLDKGKSSRKELVRGIQDVFLLKFTILEIESILLKLVKAGKLKNFNEKFGLEVSLAEELRKINFETKKFEEKIFNDWILLISNKYHEITEENKKILIHDLQIYLNKIFLKNGAECAVLIYPDDQKIDGFIKEFSDKKLEELLPARPAQILEIQKIEFPLFLRETDDNKKKYFASILDGTFAYNIIQIDPKTRQFLSSDFKNYTLYLDTNILYSLFDLENSQHATTIGKAVNAARSFGIKVRVSKQTIEEMKRSIESKGEALLESLPIKREFAEIGANLSEEENFITAYWRAYYKTGISKQDFIQKFSHVAELLKDKLIPIDQNFVNFSSEEMEKEKRTLNASIPSRKPNNVAEHDAYHRLLIKYLRKESDIKQSSERYWFLTLDTQLLIYAEKTREKGEAPFSIFPHQLLQLLRPFTKRTDDYDAAFIELFSRPQIKSAQGILPNNLAEKILAKISSFNDISPELALSIMMNSNFIATIIKENNEVVVEQKITEEVEIQLAIELKQLKKRMEALEEERLKERIKLEGLDETRKDSENKEKEINRLKTIIVIICLLLLLIINIELFINYWKITLKIIKGIWIFIDILAILLIAKVKWKVDKIFIWTSVVLGMFQFICRVIDW